MWQHFPVFRDGDEAPAAEPGSRGLMQGVEAGAIVFAHGLHFQQGATAASRSKRRHFAAFPLPPRIHDRHRPELVLRNPRPPETVRGRKSAPADGRRQVGEVYDLAHPCALVMDGTSVLQRQIDLRIPLYFLMDGSFAVSARPSSSRIDSAPITGCQQGVARETCLPFAVLSPVV